MKQFRPVLAGFTRSTSRTSAFSSFELEARTAITQAMATSRAKLGFV